MPRPELPAAFQRVREADEPFWAAQERRIQGALGQPCCTLSGISSGLIQLSGDFAVIVHGEHECAGCFRHVGPSGANFYCTGLTERELVSGQTSEPLAACLRLVAEEAKPEAIFVLGACPVEVIGDLFEDVVAAAQVEFPQIPMFALHTSGLKVGSQAAMLDWMFSTLASLPTREPVDPSWRRRLGAAGQELLTITAGGDAREMDWARDLVGSLERRRPLDPSRCLNLVGIPRSRRGRPEYHQVLGAAGLTVVGNYPGAATLRQWQAISFAKATYIADTSIYRKLVGQLRAHGQEIVEIPLPVGYDQTKIFYDAIGCQHGVSDRVQAAYEEAAFGASARVTGFKARWGGLRLAMGLRMLNNYAADQVAFHGLGDYRALSELGFEITVMVQGPPDRRDRFAEMFARRGMHHPFEIFPEPWNLSEYIGGDRFDVAYLADHCRTEARKAGVKMIVSRELSPYFDGVADNLHRLDRMLREVVG